MVYVRDEETSGMHSRLIAVLNEHPEWQKRLYAELERRGLAYEEVPVHSTLFDPAARRTIRQADLHHTSDFTPYEGLEVAGVVRQVLSRGRVIVRDGAWVGERGHGRYVARSLDPSLGL